MRKAIAVVLALVSWGPAQITPTQAIKNKDGAAKAAQFDDAVKVNIRPELRKKLAPYVAAIRYAENGGKGKEYGILHPRVKPTYRSQAGWCAATVQKNWDRWVRGGRKGEFVAFLGKRYCPVGADNDPEGLNKHWIKNVKHFHKKFNK
jgi:hypothetical protein